MKDAKFPSSTILFVDDEKELLELLEMSPIAEDVGRIWSASDPLMALEIIKNHPIDLVVLDISMPVMNGIKLLKEMRKINPYLACIYLSGHGDKMYIQEALRLGVYDFLDKPFGIDFLALNIHKALERLRFERLLREILELFICENTSLDFSRYNALTQEEKDKIIGAALGTARMKLANKKARIC